MPKAYEAMRDKFAAGGLDYDKAQAKAAAIYNSTHKQKMGGSHDDMVKRARRRHAARKAMGMK